MKTKQKTILLAMAAVFAGSLLAMGSAFAEKPVSPAPASDPDEYQGAPSERKVSICHIAGRSHVANMLDLNVSLSAWDGHGNGVAHSQHYGNSSNGPIFDKLGTCDESANRTGNLVVINGCSGDARTALINASRSYFDPVVLPETLTEDHFIAASNCANNRLGQGKDNVSNGGATHVIQGCQDLGDRGNYRSALKAAVGASAGAAVIVSDSSMDNQAVREAYRGCVSATDSAAGTNVAKHLGDSGHKFRVVTNCAAGSADTLRSAIANYRNAGNNEAIILNERSLTDSTVAAAVDACVTGGATRTDVPSTSGGSHTGFSGKLNQLEKNRR